MVIVLAESVEGLESVELELAVRLHPNIVALISAQPSPVVLLLLSVVMSAYRLLLVLVMTLGLIVELRLSFVEPAPDLQSLAVDLQLTYSLVCSNTAEPTLTQR